MSSCFSNVIADAAKNAVSNAATNLNQRLYERAQRVIPGGVNSPVRAFRAVGGTPRFVQRAQGAYFWDANGSRYIDYIGSWGPMILGHGHPAVLEAVEKPCAMAFLLERQPSAKLSWLRKF